MWAVPINRILVTRGGPKDIIEFKTRMNGSNLHPNHLNEVVTNVLPCAAASRTSL